MAVRYYLILLFLLLSPSISFGLSFSIESRNSDDKQDLMAFLTESSDYLPELISEKIPKKIYIDVFDSKNQISLDCKGSSNEALLGQAFSLRKNKIQLNRQLLAFWKLNKPLDCKFGSSRKYAISVVIHELMHIFDQNNEYQSSFSGRSCQSHPYSISGDSCDPMLFKYSNHPNILFANYWYLRGINNNLDKNHMGNPYLFKNTEESFAVSFEYFLLDPQFKCKRPLVYSSFSRIFHTSPYKNTFCSPSKSVLTEKELKKLDLNLDRLESAEFVFIGPGHDLLSSFGHPGVRFNFCIDSSCRFKRRIVSSFKGFVDDTYVKSFKGLTGDYKSFPQFYSFQHLVEKYTNNEYRDVFVYKLNLNKDQIRSLFQQFVEMFWTYRSSYHFLNNNCAVELRNLLKAILPFPHPFWNSIASTPTRLVEELKLFQLIDKEPSESHLSLFGEVQNAFEQLKLLSPQVYEKFKSEEEYLSLPTTVKEQLFLRASSSHKNLLIAKSLFLIEQEYFIYLLKMKIDVGSKEVQDKIDRDEELKGLYLDIASIKHQILTTDILRSDYRFGIPKADQVTGLPMIYALGQNLSQKRAELTILAEKYVDSGIISKISEQKEWIRFLRNRVSRRE